MANALSASVMSGVIADCTISATFRNLFRPFDSHGFTTSVSPTFSIRTDRFDSQVWKNAPSEFIPTPIGVRQLRPSIVPPCSTWYFCVPWVIFWTWDFGTSVGSVFIPHGKTNVDATASACAAPLSGRPCRRGRVPLRPHRPSPTRATADTRERPTRRGPRPAAR